MRTKDLFDQIAILIHKEFMGLNKRFDDLSKTHKQMLQKDKELLKGQDRIAKEMATKADVQDVGKKIDTYMEIIAVYRTKQAELEEKIEAILEYLGIQDD